MGPDWLSFVTQVKYAGGCNNVVFSQEAEQHFITSGLEDQTVKAWDFTRGLEPVLVKKLGRNVEQVQYFCGGILATTEDGYAVFINEQGQAIEERFFESPVTALAVKGQVIGWTNCI